MAKPRCEKHKRSLPYCDDCKAAVKQAEEQPAREEQAAALESEVGFPYVGESDPGGTPEGHGPGNARAEVEAPRPTPTEARIEALEAQTPESVEAEAEEQPADPEGPLPEGGPGPDAEPADVGGAFPADDGPDWDKQIDQAEETFRTGASEPSDDRLDDPWADGKTPAEGDEVGDWVPPCQREGAEVTGCGDCGGECQGHADPGAAEFVTIEVTPQVRRLIESIEHAISNGQEVTVIMGDAETRLRQEGRKEVVAWVREYFADGIDTVAFKLLEHLEKKVR